jgi:transcriptional regulator with XRE-family HTH domain
MKTDTRMRASDALKAEFSRALLSALAKAGMNQSELARRVGVTRDAISTYARQRSLPPPDVLKKMSKVLGVDADDLLPTRYSYEEEPAFAIEMRPNGQVRLRVDLEVPIAVGVEVIAKLQPHAPTASKRSR